MSAIENVSRRRFLAGGIIAAGEGRRLREAGYTVPKPLVPVAGVPLIESPRAVRQANHLPVPEP